MHIAVAHQDELRVDTVGEKRFCEGFLSGHSSLVQLQPYIEKADQHRRADAAMNKRLEAEGKAKTETYKPAETKLQTSAQVIDIKQSKK